MQKCVFDKSSVKEQLILLSELLENQREKKKNLLAYLEKVSEYISNPSNINYSETLVSCLKDVQKIFNDIKFNLDSLNELKLFIENISKSTSLSIIDFEKYSNQLTELKEQINNTNILYSQFIEKLISISSIDFSGLDYIKSENNIKTLEPSINFESSIFKNPKYEQLLKNLKERHLKNKKLLEENPIENTLNTNTSFETTKNINKTIIENKKVFTEEQINYILNGNFDIRNINYLDESVIEKNTEIENFSSEKQFTNIFNTNINLENINPLNNNSSNNTEKILEKPEISEDNQTESTNNINLETNNYIEKNIDISKTNLDDNLLEKTLVINKEENIAIFPYSLLDLEEVFSENPENYSSINDIIKKIYTVSLDDYKNTSFSRFKQTYKLAKEKSKYSFFKSLFYANKLFLKRKVEPIIIASCNSVNELNSYLDCLKRKKITSFNYFNIIKK